MTKPNLYKLLELLVKYVVGGSHPCGLSNTYTYVYPGLRLKGTY